jgi:hypothetical protein
LLRHCYLTFTYLWIFQNFSLLIFSLIPLLLERFLYMSIILNVLQLVLCPTTWFILGNVRVDLRRIRVLLLLDGMFCVCLWGWFGLKCSSLVSIFTFYWMICPLFWAQAISLLNQCLGNGTFTTTLAQGLKARYQ